MGMFKASMALTNFQFSPSKMSPTRRWARRVPEEVKVTGVVGGNPPSRGSSDGRNPERTTSKSRSL